MNVTRNVPRTEFAAEVRSECCKSVTYLAFLAHSSVNHFLYNVICVWIESMKGSF